MKKQRKASVVLRTLVVLLMVSFCIGYWMVTITPASIKGQKITVLLQGGSSEEQWQTKYFQEFEAKTGAKIEHISIPGEYLFQKILLALGAGRSPYDVIMVDSSEIATVAELEYVEDMGKYLTKDEKASFFPVALDVCSWKGVLRAVPNSLGITLLFYRTDLYQQYGIAGPPKTWEEFVSIAQKLTLDVNGDGKTDVWGTLVEAKMTLEPTVWFFNWLGSAGGDLYDEEGNVTINNKAGVQALTMLVDLVHKWKVAPPNATALWTVDAHTMFSEGKVAMPLSWNYVARIAQNPNVSKIVDKWDVTLFPKNVRYGGSPGGYAFAIPTSSQRKEAAWEYIKFMSMTPHVINDFFITFLSIPPKFDVIADPEVRKAGPKNLKSPFIDVLGEAIRVATPRPIHPQIQMINDLLMGAIQEAIMLKKSPQEAFDDLAEQL